ncbi:MAG: YihA family ribosome biosis GTP-binding protein [Verrucomicrobiales bacterium]|nr:YihA family ribosome biosis GTP-binding protein [Verrucomicrobiales bacterium]
MEVYLQHRPNLACVFALIDSGLPPQKNDLEFVEWLTRHKIPYVLVFTKTDQGTPEEVEANIAAFTTRIAPWFTELPEVLRCSSATGQGRSELLEVINATLKAGPAEPAPAPPTAPLPAEVEPPFSMQVRAGSARDKSLRTKKRPKISRPW